MKKRRIQKKLDKVIEDLDKDISELEPEELDRVVAAFSQEGIDMRRARKTVRYQLYRLRSESLGKCASVSEEGFKEKFEVQEAFTAWRDFANSWDVSFDDPYRVISRRTAEADEWDAVVASKFPQISHDGRVSYPDMKVKAAVDKESALQNKGK